MKFSCTRMSVVDALDLVLFLQQLIQFGDVSRLVVNGNRGVFDDGTGFVITSHAGHHTQARFS